jgi:lipid-binding SYLF domain-containing protein
MRKLNFLFVAAAFTAPALFADQHAADRLSDATTVIQEMTQMNDKGIPQDLIDRAQCVVVVPGLKKAGFIIGGKFGRGFVACRKPGNHAGWTAPAAVRIEGGSVGFQIGGSEQDVILLVMNPSGQNKLLQSKFTIGGEATAAAGPVGRDATAQTDAQMHAEILSYSRSRGLFAGIALQGATLRPDEDANKELYGRALANREILSGSVAAPAAASSFEGALNRESIHKQG